MTPSSEASNESLSKIFGSILSSASLLIVAALCWATGIAAASGGIGRYFLEIPNWPTPIEGLMPIFLVSILINFGFLGFWHNFTAPRYDNHEREAIQWVLACLGVSLILIAAVFHVGSFLDIYDILAVAALSCPLYIYVFYAYRLYKRSADAKNDFSKRYISFENQIFLPAFVFCFTNFSLGLYSALILIGTDLTYELIIFPITSWAVLVFYYKYEGSTVHLAFSLPAFAMLISLFLFVFTDFLAPKYFMVAISITYALGVAEVAKRVFFIKTSRSGYDTDERHMFFLCGANWGSVVFPLFILLLPAFFEEMSFSPIIAIVMVFVLLWLNLSDDIKSSGWGSTISVGYGVLLPMAFIAAFTVKKILPDIDFSSLNLPGTITGLLALVGFAAGLLRLAKDIFGLKLHVFVRNIWNYRIYKFGTACLFLLFFSTLLLCATLTLSWFLLALSPNFLINDQTKLLLAQRLLITAASANILSLLAFLTTFLTPRRLKELSEGADKINQLEPTRENPERKGSSKQNKSLLSTFRMITLFKYILISGRIGVSWIAGLAAALSVQSYTLGPTILSMAAFLAMTFVTMVGFIFNDIYDREKDQLAGKHRPITTGVLEVRSAIYASTLMICISIALTLTYLSVASTIGILTIILALILYSPCSSQFPVTKGVYTALLAVSPFAYAGLTSPFGISGQVVSLIFLYIVFREIILDALDVKGDSAAGIRTIATLLNTKFLIIFGWVGLFICLALGFYVFTSYESRILLSLAILIQAIAIGRFISDPHSGMRITRISMVLGVIAGSLSA